MVSRVLVVIDALRLGTIFGTFGQGLHLRWGRPELLFRLLVLVSFGIMLLKKCFGEYASVLVCRIRQFPLFCCCGQLKCVVFDLK